MLAASLCGETQIVPEIHGISKFFIIFMNFGQDKFFFCPNLIKFTQYVQKKILRLIGYKSHRVHTGGDVDPAFLGQKTCLFSQFRIHPLEELSLIEIYWMKFF
jgi:hypothetical protein